MAREKPKATISPANAISHVNVATVRRSARERSTCCEATKSTASASAEALRPVAATQNSAAARRNTGIPIASGKRAAFQGQAVAARTAQAETTMTRRLRGSDGLARTARPRASPGPPGLHERIGDDQDRQEEEHHDDGTPEPGGSVSSRRDVQVVFRELPQDQTEDERRPGPSGRDHRIAKGAEDEHRDQIPVAVVCRVAADEDEKHDEGDEEMGPDGRELRELVDEHEARTHRDDVREDDRPRSEERRVGQECPSL